MEYAEVGMRMGKDGMTAAILDSYAKTVESRELVDSEFPRVLRKAARLLREHCREVQEYERQKVELFRRVR